MATRGKLNYLPSQVFCNEGQTTILVEMWEKMSEKLNLWKDEEIKDEIQGKKPCNDIWKSFNAQMHHCITNTCTFQLKYESRIMVNKCFLLVLHSPDFQQKFVQH
jgi:hypothetical protein